MYRETEGLNLIAWIVLAVLAVPAGLIAAAFFAGCVYLICMKELAKAAVMWLWSLGGPSDALS